MEITPVAYLQSLRMQRAKQLLTSTDMKIRSVADACGYGNEKYFYRRFRRRNGLTPGQWRRRFG
jgi:transcriptional regulator GlxA family with amidase domain